MTALVACRFGKAGGMVPCTDAELSTACQAIIANENHLRNDRNRLCE